MHVRALLTCYYIPQHGELSVSERRAIEKKNVHMYMCTERVQAMLQLDICT